MGNKKSRIQFNPDEPLKDDATFLVQGNFGSKHLKLNSDMTVEDLDSKTPQSEKVLGHIFYNHERSTYMYLGYNGNVRSNFISNKPTFDDYKRSFILKAKPLDYLQLQNMHIDSRMMDPINISNPYDLYVINLKHREDRRNEVLQDIKDTKIFNIKFFEAVKHKKGWIGCGLSHLYLVSYALTHNLPYIIVAEDDFQFKINEDKIKSALDLLLSPENISKWDVFNGSPTFFERESENKPVCYYKFNNNLDEQFVKIDWGQSTSFMIYNASSYQKILRYSFKENTIIDQYVSRKFIQVAYKLGPFCIQRSSVSDLSNSFRGEEYEQYFIDYANKIAKETTNETEKTIGIQAIYVGQYTKFYENFIKNCEDFFLPQYKKYYYIATDDENLIKPKHMEDRIFFLKIKKIGWPYETLYRFKYFLMFKQEDIEKSDYIYFVNGNGQFVNHINTEVFPDNSGYVFTHHHGFKNKKFEKQSFEKKNHNSTAFIQKNKNVKYNYYAGGFYGATREKYLQMCSILDKNISLDEENDYIAEWHDESHINHFTNIVLNQKFKKLDIEYHVPQEKIRDFKVVKLIYLDKRIYLDQNSGVKDLKKCNKNIHGKIIINDYNTEFLSKIKSEFKIVFKYQYNVGGLGDMIRGMTNCLVLSKIFNVDLYFDIHHPISNHFEYKKLPESVKKIELNLIDYTLHSNITEDLDDFLENLFYRKNKYNNNYLVLLNNITFYEKLKTYINCEELYKQSYKEVFNVFKPKSYLLSINNNLDNIVHIRFGDKFLNEATSSKMDNRSGDPNTIKNELLEVYEKFGKCKLVSDNLSIIKTYGSEFLEKFDLETRPSIHFAYENTKNIDIIPTLQTFFDFKNYKNIIVKSYSGFSFLASLCFDINYINFTGEPAKFSQSIL
jgi:hypothetical protein